PDRLLLDAQFRLDAGRCQPDAGALHVLAALRDDHGAAGQRGRLRPGAGRQGGNHLPLCWAPYKPVRQLSVWSGLWSAMFSRHRCGKLAAPCFVQLSTTVSGGLIMNKFIVTLVAIAVGTVSGCAEMTETQRTTGTGAAIGAAAGAVVGGLTGGGGKGVATGAVVGGALGAGGGYLWSQHMQEQKASMEQATRGSGVRVSQTADNQLKLDIPSDISFDSGRSDIKSNLSPILDRFAITLNQNPVTTVKIIGHTDSTGSDLVNEPLSVNRAIATRDYLARHGVASNRISVDGRGSHEPVADNNSAAGRAMNRRVEIFVAESAR